MNKPAVLRIAFKELKDISRDRRSLFISLVFPLILFPLIFGAFESSLLSSKKEGEKNIRIALNFTEKNPLADFLLLQEKITLIQTSTPVYSLSKKEADTAVVIPSAADGKNSIIEITADNSRQKSVSAAAFAEELIAAYLNMDKSGTKNITPAEQTQRDLTESINSETAFLIKRNTLFPPEVGNSMLTLSLILPLLLMTFTSVSTTAVAADLGAGEKERQTLEPLLANPASRIQILAGKFLAVTLMGIAGVISFTAGFIIAYRINPDFLGTGEFVFTITGLPLALLCIQALLLSMIFGSAELALSIFARSVKEAQIMFIPLLMASMACGYSVTMISPQSSAAALFRHIPLVNIAFLVKELALDTASDAAIIITFIWSIIYIAIFLAASIAYFSSEKVILRS